MSLEDFELLEQLGTGAFSVVHKVLRRTDQQIYALKKVSMQGLKEKDKHNSVNEVRILASLDHPNIIAYREAFIDSTSNSLW